LDAIVTLWKYRRVLLATAGQGLAQRFRGNVFGSLWFALYPILFLSTYSIVFIQVLGVRVPGVGTRDYVLTIFCGLVPFLAFSEAIGVGTASVVGNRGLLRNTLFPIELVVARDVLVGHATMGIGMGIVFAVVVTLHGWMWTSLLVPVVYAMQIFATLGVVWILASLTVFFRDIQQAIPIAILLLMLVSPIGYTESMVPAGLQGLLLWNPLAWLMHLYRAVLQDGVVPVGDLLRFACFTAISFLGGFRVIHRLKPLMADYV
jgi:lipopolysaccharide transport system permease protein